jgi:hypothetical protein
MAAFATGDLRSVTNTAFPSAVHVMLAISS